MEPAFPTSSGRSSSNGSCRPTEGRAATGAAAGTGSPPRWPSARASLATCPAPRSFSSLTVLAHMSNADDLATAPDGSLWASDAASVLEHLDASGHVLARLADPHVPEGMVVLSDG